MAQPNLWFLVVLALSLFGTVPVAHTASEEPAGTEQQLLPGNRVLLGTVEEVRSDQARINTGEGQPRFIPMNVRKDKGLLDLKKKVNRRTGEASEIVSHHKKHIVA